MAMALRCRHRRGILQLLTSSFIVATSITTTLAEERQIRMQQQLHVEIITARESIGTQQQRTTTTTTTTRIIVVVHNAIP
jgi:hypothetical protein